MFSYYKLPVIKKMTEKLQTITGLQKYTYVSSDTDLGCIQNHSLFPKCWSNWWVQALNDDHTLFSGLNVSHNALWKAVYKQSSLTKQYILSFSAVINEKLHMLLIINS